MFKSALVAGAAVSCLACAAPAAPPPASAFGRVPAIVEASISPDGKRLAILGGAADQRFVSIATFDQQGLPTLPLGAVDAESLRWAGDDYVIASVGVWEKLGPREEYRFERNIAISPDGRALSRLLGKDQNSEYLVTQPYLGAVSGKPTRVIVQGLTLSSGASSDMNTKITRKGVDNPFIAALWNVDPTTGEGKLAERGNYDTYGWDVDSSGQARVRYDLDQITHVRTVWARAKGVSAWTKVWSDDGNPDKPGGLLGYSEPEDAVYISDGRQVSVRRLKDGATTPVGQVFSGTDRILLTDELTRSVTGIQSGAEKPVIEWLDPAIGDVHAALSRVFKDKRVMLSGWSADRTRFVARVSAPAAPAVWYLFDKTRKELSPLGEEYPELKDAQLGTTRWITYKARDGMEIPAYLTLPPGKAAGAKAPLVVLPHGGPEARDDYDFDFLAQFLATRGYAVLQPQFRGSAGFGQDFALAGRGEWGGKMQTDLLDGIAAAAATGDVDPKRACIVGASYGGYAALAGATMHGDSYRCAISVAGVSDLGLLLVEKSRNYGRDSAALEGWRRMLGNASTATIQATSPAKLADKTSVPILLIHGDKDDVVPFEQSELMAKSLKAAGKPVEFVTLAGENHYLTHTATRTQMLQAMEGFLGKNLPVQ